MSVSPKYLDLQNRNVCHYSCGLVGSDPIGGYRSLLTIIAFEAIQHAVYCYKCRLVICADHPLSWGIKLKRF
jgi:hypothetical protein